MSGPPSKRRRPAWRNNGLSIFPFIDLSIPSGRSLSSCEEGAVDPSVTNPKLMLAFGEFEKDARSCLSVAALESAVELHTLSSSSQASAWLSENEASALLLNGTGDEPAQVALGARAQHKNRTLPILALTNDVGDLDFAHAFSWGADDVVAPSSSRSLTTRLRAVSKVPALTEVPPRGTAVIAEIDQQRRVAMARVLGNAGYEVRFALTCEDLERFALERNVALVVSCTEICPDPERLIAAAHSSGSGAAFVISAEPKRYAELSRRFTGGSDARVTDASAPPENVLFLANELAAGPLPNKRSAVRILYGTSVHFRPEGLIEGEVGFTYNVSSGGMYVRTLAPPTEDVVWLELTPPRSGRRVQLVGQVVWRRPFGPHKTATVPPGFGVRIIDGAKQSLERWDEGCAQAAAAF